MANPIDNISRYVDLTPEDIILLQSAMHEQKFKRGTIIEAYSEILNTYYIIRGSARVYYILNGRERTFSFAFEDEFVVVAKQLIDTPGAVIQIQFMEPTDAFVISEQEIRATLSNLHRRYADQVSSFIIQNFARYSLSLEERMIMLQTMTAKEKYQWLLHRYPHITERATITQIASFLGMTKETLYRIRSGAY